MNDPDYSSLDALFARARVSRLDTARAEFGFETRLLARLREMRAPARSGIGRFASRLLPYRASQQAEQAASLQNPEAMDLFATFP